MQLVRSASLYRDGIAVRPETCKAMYVADTMHLELVSREVEVTSILDGVHHINSRHYIGLAFDIRIWYLHSETLKSRFVAELSSRLGRYYDVVLNPNHIHVEFDPKFPSI